MTDERFMRPSSVVVSCDECGRRRPEHAPACSHFAGGSKPAETDADPTAFDAERERLTAPLAGVDNIAHRVALRVLAERPNDPQVQQQWAGRLQGMAMAGLVWRTPGRPWKLTSHARALLAAGNPSPSGDYLPLPEMLELLAEAKDRRDAIGVRIAKPGVADPKLVDAWDEARTAEWRIVDEIVGAARAGEPGYPPVPDAPDPAP